MTRSLQISLLELLALTLLAALGAAAMTQVTTTSLILTRIGFYILLFSALGCVASNDPRRRWFAAGFVSGSLLHTLLEAVSSMGDFARVSPAVLLLSALYSAVSDDSFDAGQGAQIFWENGVIVVSVIIGVIVGGAMQAIKAHRPPEEQLKR